MSDDRFTPSVGTPLTPLPPSEGFKLGGVARLPKTATEAVWEDAEKKRREFLENVEALIRAARLAQTFECAHACLNQAAPTVHGEERHHTEICNLLTKALVPFTPLGPFTEEPKGNDDDAEV